MSGAHLPRAYSATPVTDKDTLHKATLAICSMAGDAKTARPVLEMLALIEPLGEQPEKRPNRWGR